MHSVFISTKRYFDKTGGNSYFATRVEVDGVEVIRLPFQYGYESADEWAVYRELKRIGILPFTERERGLWYAVKESGAVLYRSPIAYFTKREVKRWGEND